MRAAFIALLLLAGEALACGYCVEDKIAATYDHAVVTRAMAMKHHVAFFHVDGAALTKRELEEAVGAAPGIDRDSVRISPDVLTVSLSFDPRRVSLAELNARLDRKLAKRKAALLPLLVMERPADLKLVKR